METGLYIDRYEFEQTILCEDGNNDLVTGFRIVIKQWETASMSLDKTLGSIVK